MDNYEVIWSRESVYDVADISDYIDYDLVQKELISSMMKLMM